MADLSQDPIINVIHNNIKKGIDVTLGNKCLGSAVILILSAIDAMAYLGMPENQEDVTKTDFIDWAERYICFPGREQLTGADLYGARCAVLHSFGVRSKMSRAGRCRMIAYMDQSEPPIRYEPKVSRGLVLVSVPALRDALFEGIDKFLIDLYKEPQSKKAQVADKRFRSLMHTVPARELEGKEGKNKR